MMARAARVLSRIKAGRVAATIVCRMTIPASGRDYAGPALLSLGFRPFFLLGSFWAAVAVPLWVWSFLGGSAPLAHRDWHVHEMLFGFLGAVLAGFLTTAVPNWTGRPPLTGAPLAALVGLWIAGRAGMLAAFWLGPIAAVIDAAFLVSLAALVWREVIAARNVRNIPVAGLVSLLALANIAFHAGAASGQSGLGERGAIGALCLLLSLVGGRITPAFTGNWMRARGIGPEPDAFSGIDRVAIGATALAAMLWTAQPEGALGGAALAVAGAAQLARLSRWRGWLSASEPLVWILHVGYAWLGTGLLLLGASRLSSIVPSTAGVHALTAGAVGVMTLAVMSRASRGHTGRPLAADPFTTCLYIWIVLAALARVAAPFAGAAQSALLIGSAILWCLAFGGFAAGYGRMLTSARPAGG